MASILWIGLAALGLFLFYWKSIYEALCERHRLIKAMAKIPGPPAIPILGVTWMLKWKVEGLVDQLFEWFSIYTNEGVGAINLWLGPQPMVIVINAEYIKAVLESNTLISKGKEYSIIERWLGTGLLTSTGDKWRNRRKMLTPAFHFNILNSFVFSHDKEAQIFINTIEKFSDNDKIFDIFPFVKRCALDIICETSMGTKINAQINYDHPYVMAVQRMNELSFLYTRMPWMWLKPIWYASGYGNEYDHTLKLVTDFTRKVIEERGREFRQNPPQHPTNGSIEGTKKRYAFLDLLLSVQDEGKLTTEDIREEVDTFMFEGHDTTSSGMGWTLWTLAHHPEIQEKVIQEIDAVFGDSNRPCTPDDLKELKYLENCIKESLRLFPPVPLFTRRVEEDVECDELIIPRGATVLVSPLMVHRNNRYWEDPETFNPDNFTPENISKRHPFAYVPFSAGPRNCIGQKFALMEEKTVLSWFFRRYKIRAELPWMENRALPQIITIPSHGFPVKIYKRSKI